MIGSVRDPPQLKWVVGLTRHPHPFKVKSKKKTRVFSVLVFGFYFSSAHLIYDFCLVNQTKENDFFSLDFSMNNQTSEKNYIHFLIFFFLSIFPPNFLSLAFFGNQI